MDNQGCSLGISLYFQVRSNARKIPILLRSLFFRIRKFGLSCIRWLRAGAALLDRIPSWIRYGIGDLLIFICTVALFLGIYILVWW